MLVDIQENADFSENSIVVNLKRICSYSHPFKNKTDTNFKVLKEEQSKLKKEMERIMKVVEDKSKELDAVSC